MSIILLGLCSIAIAESDIQSFPGNSIANAVLKRDTLPTVLVLAGGQNRSCKASETQVIDTQVQQAPARPGLDPWQEIWTIKSCKQEMKMLVIFTPTGPARPGIDYLVKFLSKTPYRSVTK